MGKAAPMAVTGFNIQTRHAVLAGGPYGAAGAYEKLAGVLQFEVDPEHPLNADITDLDRAPRNAAGRVEFQGDFYLLRPVDPARSNRRLLLDVPNRGRNVALGMFNSAPRVPDPEAPEEFGDGFLMRHGWTVAWVGWQHDVPRREGLMALTVPAARHPQGIIGRVRCQWRPNTSAASLPLADRYHIPHPATDLEDPEAQLTVRDHAGAPVVAVPRRAWRFARRDGSHVVPDASSLYLEPGFEPGRIYELVYRAQNPPIVGLGFLAVRDTATFLRFGSGALGNLCAGELDRVYAFGVSQSGRFLRHLLYLGLDEDEAGRPAFDGVFVHVAGARRGEFNHRFAQPSLNAVEAVGSLFPFTDTVETDPVTGQRDGLLRRLAARDRWPKIFMINSSAEYWRGDASLVHTDVRGRRDVEPLDAVRVYLFAGTQHTPGAVPPPDADLNTGDRGGHVFNVVDYAPLLRAALVNLDRWVSEGVEPPASAVPCLAGGTAVPAESTAPVFRAIPSCRFPDRLIRPCRLEFGPAAARGILSELPPKAGAPFVTLVSALDVDGNEVAGIRPPELLVPLATYTGWNPRHPDQGAPGDLMPMMGSTLPFTWTRATREAVGDPRASVEERYVSRVAYLAAVREAARLLVEVRHVLGEDVEAIVQRAGYLWDWLRSRSA